MMLHEVKMCFTVKDVRKQISHLQIDSLPCWTEYIRVLRGAVLPPVHSMPHVHVHYNNRV